MSAPSPSLRAAGAAAVVALVGGLAYGLLTPTVTHRHSTVTRPGHVPTRCYAVTALASQQALALAGVSGDAGAPEYVHARICTTPGDGGTAALPAGMAALDDTLGPEEVADGGEPELEVWVQGEASAPFPCACSTGSGCSVPGDGGLVAAPLGVTLQPGWSGIGCVPKPCVELSGFSSWPSGCPEK